MKHKPSSALAKPLGATILIAAISAAIILSIETGIFPPKPPNCNLSSAVTITILNGSTVNTNASITYSPKTAIVILNVNDTVVWKNADSNDHTVSSVSTAPQQFESGDIFPGATYCHHFTQPGTYNYFCRYHSWMQGTIIVRAS